jgi:hypothetical protein
MVCSCLNAAPILYLLVKRDLSATELFMFAVVDATECSTVLVTLAVFSDVLINEVT